MSGFPVFPREVKGIHASAESFAGIWRTHKLGEDSAAEAFSFQVGLSLSTRGIDDEFLPERRPDGGGDDEIRYSKYAFGSGLDILKGRFQLSGRGGGSGDEDAKGQWTGKVQSGRLLFKWNVPTATEAHGTGTMKLMSKDEAIVLGFPRTDYNVPADDMGVRLYRMRLASSGGGGDDAEKGSLGAGTHSSSYRVSETHSSAYLGGGGVGGGGGGGSMFPLSFISSLTSGVSTAFTSSASSRYTSNTAAAPDDDDHSDDQAAAAKYAGISDDATDSIISTVRRNRASRGCLPSVGQVLGDGKLRVAYENVAHKVDKAYGDAKMHWISIAPLYRCRILTAIAVFFCVIFAFKSGPLLQSIGDSQLAEAVSDFFNAPHPPYPTTDKLWRFLEKAGGGEAPCHSELMNAQPAVWLHNTCHFQSPWAATAAAAADTPGIEAPMIDIILNDYLTIRRKQDQERAKQNRSPNTFWIFDVGGGDVRSTHKIVGALEGMAGAGRLQQNEYKVVAYDPDPNSYAAGVRFQQQHYNFFMQQAVVSDFTGPAKVYMVDRKGQFGPSSAVTEPSMVGANNRVTSVEQTMAISLDDAIDRMVSHEDDVPLVYLGSGGHELTIMLGLVRQLSRKRVHTLFWEHANLGGEQPGEKPAGAHLNKDEGYQSAVKLEAEVQFMASFGYRVYVLGYNKFLARPHLIRVDGDFLTLGMHNAIGCFNPAALMLMAVAQGHPSLDRETVESLMTCLPPATTSLGGVGGSGSGGVGGGGGVGFLGRRSLFQFQPLQRPTLVPGQCACMPTATLDCGTQVWSTCGVPSVAQAPRRMPSGMMAQPMGMMQQQPQQPQQQPMGGFVQQQQQQQPMYGR